MFLWIHHQKILDAARKDGQLNSDMELFDGAYYISPELPKDCMISLIESLKTRINCSVQISDHQQSLGYEEGPSKEL